MPPPLKPPPQAPNYGRQLAVAMELPFVLVSAVLVGGLIGYLLDRWWHTKPWLMLVFGALGLFAGVRDVLRRLSKETDGNQGNANR